MSTLAVKVFKSSGLSVASTGCKPLNNAVMSKDGTVMEVGMCLTGAAAGAPSEGFATSRYRRPVSA